MSAAGSRDEAATVFVLNGPNLGRLGTRDPAVYGTATYADLVGECEATARELGIVVDVRQTDAEGEMIGWLHDAADTASGVVLNAGAWSHYSYAVADAAAMVTGAGIPLVEVHLSQVAAREPWRHASVLSAYATGTITGLRVDSYRLALRYLAAATADPRPAPR